MENYLTVSALSKYIKVKFEKDPYLQTTFVKGELSNYKKHSSGHHYFNLKDDKAVINCMMFKGDASRLNFSPKEGDGVLVKGRISVYESRGSYQMYVSEMSLDGVGMLYEKYEALKKEFIKKGYFDADRKKKLTRFPKKIAVLTASTGAAIRDIETTLRRRYPIAEVIYLSTLVQGEGAKEDIVKNIKQADEMGVDVIIVGRGGGSIEDLWAFNEADVVEAIYHAKTPIISAVGHETDTTLSDLAADIRAATPTAAAMIATPDKQELMDFLKKSELNLYQKLINKLQMKQQRLDYFSSYRVFVNPAILTDQKLQRIDELDNQLKYYMNHKFQTYHHKYNELNYKLDIRAFESKTHLLKTNLSNLEQKLSHQIVQNVKNNKIALSHHLALLNSLSPTAVMMRGYGIINKDEHVITSVEQLKVDDAVTVQLKDGSINAQVLEIHK